MVWWQDGKTWLLNPSDQSLAFLLADNGCDVWIADTRGTKYSLGHKTLGISVAVILPLHYFSVTFLLLFCKISYFLCNEISYQCHSFSLIGTGQWGELVAVDFPPYFIICMTSGTKAAFCWAFSGEHTHLQLFHFFLVLL